jgi:fido (protein-threonine AMPylation protein)
MSKRDFDPNSPIAEIKFSKTEMHFIAESNAIEDVRDSKSLNFALKAWEYVRSLPRLETSSIKRAHRILMHDKLPPHQLGHYRAKNEHVRVGGRLGLYPEYIQSSMRDWYKRSWEPMDPYKIQEHHVEFEKIHPFIDGNGRIGRMLMNYIRIKNGYDIMIIWEKEKQQYYDWFKPTLHELLLSQMRQNWGDL